MMTVRGGWVTAVLSLLAVVLVGTLTVFRTLSIDQRSQLIRIQMVILAEFIVFLGSRYVWRSFRDGLVAVPFLVCNLIVKSIIVLVLTLAQLSFVIQYLISGADPLLLSVASFASLGIMVQFVTCQFILNRLATLLSWASSKLTVPHSKSLHSSLRRKSFLLSVLLTVSLSLYGIHGGRLPPFIKTVEIPIKGLSASMDRMSIAVVSDIHLGPTVGRTKVEQIVSMVNDLNPDIIAVIGDLTDSSVERAHLAAEPLAQLRARLGKYFVSGNHEYHTADVVNWFEHLTSHLGFTVLHNSHVNITDRLGGFLYLAGTDDIDARMMQHNDHGMDLDKAVGSCDRHQPIVLLAHQPRAAKLALDSQYNIQLVLSGHTHGGQMFPMVVIAYLVNPFFAGLYHYGNGHVYVTQGTVYWGIPMRMFSEAEITRVFLRSQAA